MTFAVISLTEERGSDPQIRFLIPLFLLTYSQSLLLGFVGSLRSRAGELVRLLDGPGIVTVRDTVRHLTDGLSTLVVNLMIE